MAVIRDEEGLKEGEALGTLYMIPLFCQWGVRRCNVEGCKAKPTTIVTGEAPRPFGLCEAHYQEAMGTVKKKGSAPLSLHWDDYDAFEEKT